MTKLIYKKLIVLFLYLSFPTIMVGDNLKESVLISSDINGYVSFDSIQKVITVYKYTNSKNILNPNADTDSNSYSIPLVMLSSDSSDLLTGQKDLLCTLKILSGNLRPELYVIEMPRI